MPSKRTRESEPASLNSGKHQSCAIESTVPTQTKQRKTMFRPHPSTITTAPPRSSTSPSYSTGALLLPLIARSSLGAAGALEETAAAARRRMIWRIPSIEQRQRSNTFNALAAKKSCAILDLELLAEDAMQCLG